MNLLGIAGGSVGLALSAYGSSMQSQAKSEGALLNIEAAINVRNTQATIFEQQDKEIQERLGQQLTQADLVTLSAASRLRTAQAQTGTSGGTSDLAVAEAYVVGARNRENLTISAKDQRLALARKNITGRLDSEMRVAKYQSDIPTSQEISSSILSGAMRGIDAGLNFGNNIDRYLKASDKTATLQEQNNLITQYNGVR